VARAVGAAARLQVWRVRCPDQGRSFSDRDENGPRATRRAIDEEVPGAMRRMLEGRTKEMARDPTSMSGMAGYNRTRNQYLSEMAKMRRWITLIFDPDPTSPDDYIIAKQANEELLPVINERSLEHEGVTRAVLREEKRVRKVQEDIAVLTSDMKRDLDRIREEGWCCGADMKAKHDGTLFKIKDRRRVLSSREDRLLRLRRRQWALAGLLKRDRARSAVLQERSTGAWSSLDDKIRLARDINCFIESSFTEFIETKRRGARP
jgi:hypothetical protein